MPSGETGHSSHLTMVSASLPHVVMGIIGYVFLFSTYPNVKEDYFKIWLYVLIWSSAGFVPLVNEALTRVSTVHLHRVLVLVWIATWVWGWVIIDEDSWSQFRTDYRLLSDLIWSFQIITIITESVVVKKLREEDQA